MNRFSTSGSFLVASSVAAAVFALYLFPVSAGTGTDKTARQTVLEIAKRQIELFEAKINNDWDTMYGMLTPQTRKKISLEDFKEYPHDLQNLDIIKLMEKGLNISGAKNIPTGTRDLRFSGARSQIEIEGPYGEGHDEDEGRYVPIVLGYRLDEFAISDDGIWIEVTSQVTNPAHPVIGPTISRGFEKEYWRKINGQWYVEWTLKYTLHVSGAKTDPSLPKINFTTRIGAKNLALDFLNEARAMERGRSRTRAINNALLIDPFATVEILHNENIEAGDLPRLHIRRAMLGNAAYPRLFPSVLEMGRWYALAGDYELAYKAYLRAIKIDGDQETALVGACSTAITMGDFEGAARHCISLLELYSILQKESRTVFDPYIKNGCSACPRLRHETKISLARRLVTSGKWDMAFEIYNNLLGSRSGWGTIRKELEQGKSVSLGKLKKSIGGALSEELSFLTYHDAEKILEAAGIKLFHPGNFSGLPVGDITARSAVSVSQTGYYPGYATGGVSSNAAIKLPKKNGTISSHGKSGHVAVFIGRDGGATGRFYGDDNAGVAGSSELADEIAGLKNGDMVLLASVSPLSGSVDPRAQQMLASIRASSSGLSAEDDELLLKLASKGRSGSQRAKVDEKFQKALASIGVDTLKIRKNSKGRIYLGRKGALVGDAGIWQAARVIKKSFIPSNMERLSGQNGPLVIVTGRGENATITYRP